MQSILDAINEWIKEILIDCIICLRKKGGFSLTQNQTPVTTTEHKIGKVTYLVCSSASERATDTLDKKIKKLIRKDMELNPANARK